MPQINLIRRDHATRCQAGFTLVEMAMSLVLVGLAVVALLVAFRIYVGDYSINTTKKHTQTVAQAVENFVLENGRFPCPAAIDLPVSDPFYGQEVNCIDLRGYMAGGGAGPVVNAGEFGGGIWVERGVVNPAARVVRGMVPFHALNIPEFYATDGYNTRLFYAVTASQTVADTFMREGGAISVLTAQNNASEEAERNHFIIFSAGPNKRGAYTREGQQVLPCPTGNVLESENCNTSSAHRDAVYRAMARSSAGGDNEFDDYVVNGTTMQLPLWRLDDRSAFNMRAIDLGNRVMMGDVTPLTSPAEVRVDIGGDARTSMNVMGAKYCLNGSGDDTDCFESELIAGERPEMHCGDAGYAHAEAGTYMRGIAKSQARCADNISFGCPDGQFIVGMSANGSPQCQPYTFEPPPLPDLVQNDEAQCGSAHGTQMAMAPSGGQLCSQGTPSSVQENGTAGWTWSCTEGSATASCSASAAPVDPPSGPCCGSAAGTTSEWQPLSNHCAGPGGDMTAERPPSNGQVTQSPDGTQWQWNCLYADCPAFCTANRIVNGECGPGANTTATAPPPPGAQRCRYGNASAIQGTGPWTWTCAGVHGGSDAQCSAGRPVMGECPSYPQGYPPGACTPLNGGWRCERHGNTYELQCDESPEPPMTGDCTTFTAWCSDVSTGEMVQRQFICPAFSGGPDYVVGSPEGPNHPCINSQMISRHCRTTGCYRE